MRLTILPQDEPEEPEEIRPGERVAPPEFSYEDRREAVVLLGLECERLRRMVMGPDPE